jgi:hypothetical protein
LGDDLNISGGGQEFNAYDKLSRIDRGEKSFVGPAFVLLEKKEKCAVVCAI